MTENRLEHWRNSIRPIRKLSIAWRFSGSDPGVPPLAVLVAVAAVRAERTAATCFMESFLCGFNELHCTRFKVPNLFLVVAHQREVRYYKVSILTKRELMFLSIRLSLTQLLLVNWLDERCLSLAEISP